MPKRKISSPEHPVFLSATLLILTLAFTYPTILQLSDHLIGGTDDAWICPWNDFNFRERILHGQDPYYTDYIFAPVGTSLLLHANTEFNSVLGLLLSPWFNEIAQTNIAILLATFLSGVGVYILARDFTQSVAGAYFAAIAFAFCPFRILRMAGHTNFATSQWLPLTLWSFLKLADTQQRRYVVLTGVFFALTYYSNQYYAVYLVIAFVLLLIYGLWKFPHWRNLRLIRNLATAGALALVLLLPLAVRFYKDFREGTHYQREASEALAVASAANVSDYFRIAPFNYWIQQFLDPASLDAHAKFTSGWIVLMCGLLGAILAIRLQQTKMTMFVVLGLVFLLLSLGPNAKLGTFTIPLPYALLQNIPFVNHVRIPSRFAVMVTLCLAITASYGVGWITKKWPARTGRVVLGVLFFLLLFELFPAPLSMDPFDPPKIFYQLRNREDGLMLTLPFYVGRAPASRSMSFQLAHRKKILAGRTARGGPWEIQSYFANTPVTEFFYKISEWKPKIRLDLAPRDVELAPVFRRFLNVRYLAVHPPFSQRPTVLNYLRPVFPDARLLSEEQGIQLYELPRINMNSFQYHSGQEGIRFFLFQNWDPERKGGKRIFVCRKPFAKFLLPQTTSEQRLSLHLKLKSTEPGEVQFYIDAEKIQGAYLAKEIQSVRVEIPGELVTKGHQVLTIRFDPSRAVELHSIQARIETVKQH